MVSVDGVATQNITLKPGEEWTGRLEFTHFTVEKPEVDKNAATTKAKQLPLPGSGDFTNCSFIALKDVRVFD